MKRMTLKEIVLCITGVWCIWGAAALMYSSNFWHWLLIPEMLLIAVGIILIGMGGREAD